MSDSTSTTFEGGFAGGVAAAAERQDAEAKSGSGCCGSNPEASSSGCCDETSSSGCCDEPAADSSGCCG